MNKKYILIFLFLALILIFVSYFVFKPNQANKEFESNIKNSNVIKEVEKKFYINELTGEKIYSEVEPEFLKNRPLAVMVNNALPARPQVGLTEADLIYEVIAEGGITRFLAFYYSSLPEKVGPIRSTREYYLQTVKETGDAMLMHIGFSPQAREKIDVWNIRSLGIGGGQFYRDNFGNSEIATEHTAFANGKDLLKHGLSLGWSGKTKMEVWKFNEDKTKTSEQKNANYIEINFWYKGDYSGIFKYDSTENKYVRYSGFDEKDEPILLKDRVNGKNVLVSNLIVMFAEEFPIPNDDKNRLDYKLIGEGKAYVFKDGKVLDVVWKKNSLSSRTKFYLVNGEEVEFNRGKSWISIVPSRNIEQVILK
jgi:hypothetical protein